MKRLILLAILSMFPFVLSAQLKSIKVFNQADTLLVNTSNSSVGEDVFIDLFRGSKGFCFKLLFTNHYNSTSTNSGFFDKTSFFNNPTFYIGDTPTEALATLTELLNLCGTDVATYADVTDFRGNPFYVHSATGLYLERRLIYAASDRLLIWNEDMEKPMILLQKTIEDSIKYLTKSH